MKKFAVMMLLLAGNLLTFGQTLDDINDMMGKGEYRKAKEAIDKFLADPKNAGQSDGWYFKGRVYNSLSRDTTTPMTEALQLKNDALAAFKKNQQIAGTKDLRMISEKPMYGSYNDLYNGYFDIGVNAYNAKDFATSIEAFKAGLSVGDYIRTKGYEFNGVKFLALDTSVILNIGLALKQAGKETEAVTYYKRLADANVSAPQYIDVYLYLYDYYTRNNDAAGLQGAIAKGKQFYPGTDWEQMGFEMELDKIMAIKDDKPLQLQKSEELAKKYPTNAYASYYYATKLYNAIYFSDGKVANIDALKNSLAEALKVALTTTIVEDKADANLLMSHFTYNTAFEYSDSAAKYSRGTKPADIKKKNDFNTLFKQKVDEDIIYTDLVAKYFADLPSLKGIQKQNYKLMLERLAELYNAKGDKIKAAEYTKRRDDMQ